MTMRCVEGTPPLLPSQAARQKRELSSTAKLEWSREQEQGSREARAGVLTRALA
jgi:hypothetical protein